MEGTTNRIYHYLDGDDGLLLHASTQIARRLPFTRQKSYTKERKTHQCTTTNVSSKRQITIFIQFIRSLSAEYMYPTQAKPTTSAQCKQAMLKLVIIIKPIASHVIALLWFSFSVQLTQRRLANVIQSINSLLCTKWQIIQLTTWFAYIILRNILTQPCGEIYCYEFSSIIIMVVRTNIRGH